MKSEPNRHLNSIFRSASFFTCVALAGYLVMAALFFNVLFDDIFVSLRYAQNLADGFGPTFSRGVPPVEGYSNTLLVWLVTAGIKLGIDPLVATKIISIIAGGLTLLMTVELLHRFNVSLIAKTVGVVSLICCIPYAYWIGSGTENSLYTLFLLAAVYLAAFENRSRGAFIGTLTCLCLIRPEGFAFAFGIIGLRLLFGNRKQPIVDFFRNAGILTVICLILLIWRYIIFGELLPNTYYAKTGGSILLNAGKSLTILRHGFQTFGIPMTLLMIIGFLSCRKQRKRLIPLFVLATGLLFVVYTGGDVNVPRLRFFVLYVPIMSIFVSFGVEQLSRWMPAQPRYLFLLIATGLSLWLSYQASLSSFLTPKWRTGSTFDGHIRLANQLKKSVPPGTRIALWDIGILPYELNQCRMIDLTGITDAFIAKTAGDHFHRDSQDVVDYVFRQNPDLMILNTVQIRGNQFLPEYPVIRSIVADPRFSRLYRQIHVQHTIGPYYLVTFQRIRT